MYFSKSIHTMDEIINAPVGSSMKVLAVATTISMRNAGLSKPHITIVAGSADKAHESHPSYIQIYYDIDASIDEKSRWLLDIYDKIRKEIELYGSCKMELLITKKSSDTDIAERIGQSHQYACSISHAPNSRIKLYMHDDTLNLLEKEKIKKPTLDTFFGDMDIRRG